MSQRTSQATSQAPSQAMSQATGQNWGRVAVLMGGWSSERAISLRSGQAVLDSLKRMEVDALGLDVTSPAHMVRLLMSEPFNCVFIALHGKGGEDGLTQAVCEALQLAHTGSRFGAASLCMDKIASKRLWLQGGVPVPAYCVLEEGFSASSVVKELGLPLFVKPVSEGSSIGITRVTDESQLYDAFLKARNMESRVLAEAAIETAEYALGFIGDKWLPSIKIETPRTFYDYTAKYESPDTRYICPSGLSPERERELTEIAQKGARILGASGWGRADLMEDADGKFYLLEVNVVPGMTEHSLVPKAGVQCDMDFDAVVRAIMDEAVRASATQEVKYANHA